MKNLKWSYYDNSHICGNCNGEGCKVCYRRVNDLSGFGNERFPLSLAINGCKPPEIKNPYAWNLHERSAAHIILQFKIKNS